MTCQIACSWLPAAKRLASLAALFSLGAIIPLILARAPRSSAVVFEHRPVAVPVATTPATVPSPPAALIAAAPAHVAVPRRIDCTRPLSQIGFTGNNYLSIRIPTGLRGVAASPSGCTIAIWGSHDIFLSRDDGASFVRLLPPRPLDAWADDLHTDVAIDADETVYALRGGRLEIEHRDGTTHERAIPGAAFDHIHLSGRWLVLRSRDQLAASADRGATWHLRAVPPALTSATLRLDDDGTIHLAAATGTDDPVIYYIGDASHTWRKLWISPPHRPAIDPNRNPPSDPYHVSIAAFAFGADGRLYAERNDGRGNQIFAVSPTGDATIPTELDPMLFRGALVAGTTEPWGAFDAHGLMLSLYGGRGPIRTTETHLMSYVGQQQGEGRWLIGGIAP
jgi:hypothetical protein